MSFISTFIIFAMIFLALYILIKKIKFVLTIIIILAIFYFLYHYILPGITNNSVQTVTNLIRIFFI